MLKKDSLFTKSWRPFSLYIGLILTLCLCGCFYESTVPLAPVNNKLFDEGLLGAWLQTDPIGSDQPLRIKVFQFRGPEYYIEVLSDTAASKSLQKVDRYNGYLTMVDKNMFMNVQELKPGTRPYWFFRIKKICNDTIIVTGLIEDIAPQFESSKKLYEFVKVNLSVDTVFTSVGTFARIGK
jgi:hypothetical protein